MKTSEKIIDAATAAETSDAHNIDTSKQTVFMVHTAAATTATIKFVAGFSKDRPDFSAARSADNDWHYVEVVDVEDGTQIDGATGVVVTATEKHGAYQLNVDGAYYAGVVVMPLSAGTVDVDMMTETSPSC